jgi:hypothetical protein
MEIPAEFRDKIKWPWNLILYLFVLVLSVGASWVVAFNRGAGSINCECSPQVIQQQGDSLGKADTAVPQGLEGCPKKSFSENEAEWDTAFYRKDRDGFWCPTRDLDRLMWYKDGVLVNFKALVIEYEIKRDDTFKGDNPPSFIFGYGREKPVFKLWVPENPNLQLFRFAKNLDFDSEEATLAAEPAVTLSDPVKFGKTTNTLEVKQSYAEGNELTLNFIFNYTSSLPPYKGEKDTVPKQVKMPISNVPTSAEKYPFGIGTYIGNCIRPVSYTICY